VGVAKFYYINFVLQMHTIVFFVVAAACSALGNASPRELPTLERRMRETLEPVNIDPKMVSSVEKQGGAKLRSLKSVNFKGTTVPTIASGELTSAATIHSSDGIVDVPRDSDETTPKAVNSRVPRTVDLVEAMLPFAHHVYDWKKWMFQELGRLVSPSKHSKQ
jgi:hypothetical protein